MNSFYQSAEGEIEEEKPAEKLKSEWDEGDKL
jgi:hypothetical protein